jgi:hypothetical protein
MWVCPSDESHRFEIRQCSEGVPSSCPLCNDRNIAAALSCHEPWRESRDLVESVLSSLPQSQIHWFNLDQKEMDRFLNAHREMLENFHNLTLMSPDFERPSLPQRNLMIPCFRVLKDPKMKYSESFERFKIKESLGGIFVKMFDTEALEGLRSLKNKEVNLLIGLVSILDVLDTNDRDPRKLKKDEQKQLLDKMRKSSKDALMLKDSGRAFIIFDPFPVITLCRVELIIGSDIPMISSNAAIFSTIDLSHRMDVETLKPPKDAVFLKSTTVNEPQNRHDILSGTMLENFSIDMEPPDILKPFGTDFKMKMHFFNKEAIPFAAMKRLKPLTQNVDSVSPELYLLIAAEYLEHSTIESRNYFHKYINALKEKNTWTVHPWTMLIYARAFNESLDREQHRMMISSFLSWFPEQNSLLTASELALVDDDDFENDEDKVVEKNSTLTDKLNEDWRVLKQKYPAFSSDAMDKLLELTGLAKVKEEALKIWRAAMQLKTLDEKIREKNMFTCNYVFMGNPGTFLSLIRKR